MLKHYSILCDIAIPVCLIFNHGNLCVCVQIKLLHKVVENKRYLYLYE